MSTKTRALDVVTIIHALSVLSDEIASTKWTTYNSEQAQIFAWMEEHRDLLGRLTGIDAKASRFWQELNQYLVERNFDPMVKEFDPSLGIGVVSVLDKMVNWLYGPGDLVELDTDVGVRPGFELPPRGVNIYQVEGYEESYLLELLTKSSDTLWLFLHPDLTLEGLDMVRLSMDVMGRQRSTPMHESFWGGSGPIFAGARVPMLDFNLKPNIEFLVGAQTRGADGTYSITQASQQYKLRMDEIGARVKAATVVTASRGLSIERMVFELDSPFYGWWTQNRLEQFPMAAFFAGYDSFRKPEGSLDAM